MLKVENVDVYESKEKKFHILKDINLNIREGEFLVILGKSGSGKSTLLNVLGGIEKPASGNVYFKNQEIYSSDRNTQKYIYQHVGFVFQNYNLIDNLNAYENIEIALNVRKQKKGKKEVQRYFQLFEMEKNIDKFPFEMSGGEQQRVSIIRTILLEPDIILCDEPTGALDSVSSKLVIKYLQDINKTMKKTIVMVTHDETYKEVADRIIYIKDGRIEREELND